MIKKFANARIISILDKPQGKIARTDSDSLFVKVRAISARVNKNLDGFSADELKKAYKTFIGKNIFINHDNQDEKKSVGKIIDSVFHDGITLAYNEKPGNEAWIELTLQVTDPHYAQKIRDKKINSVSMGCFAGFSVCSICGNKARYENQFCKHIKNKGSSFEVESAEGEVTTQTAWEDNKSLSFFEISLMNDIEPADDTANVLQILNRKKVIDDMKKNIQTKHSKKVGKITFIPDGQKKVAAEIKPEDNIEDSPQERLAKIKAKILERRKSLAKKKAFLKRAKARLLAKKAEEEKKEEIPIEAIPTPKDEDKKSTENLLDSKKDNHTAVYLYDNNLVRVINLDTGEVTENKNDDEDTAREVFDSKGKDIKNTEPNLIEDNVFVAMRIAEMMDERGIISSSQKIDKIQELAKKSAIELDAIKETLSLTVQPNIRRKIASIRPISVNTDVGNDGLEALFR